jgi:hypothetical protein
MSLRCSFEWEELTIPSHKPGLVGFVRQSGSKQELCRRKTMLCHGGTPDGAVETVRPERVTGVLEGTYRQSSTPIEG